VFHLVNPRHKDVPWSPRTNPNACLAAYAHACMLITSVPYAASTPMCGATSCRRARAPIGGRRYMYGRKRVHRTRVPSAPPPYVTDRSIGPCHEPIDPSSVPPHYTLFVWSPVCRSAPGNSQSRLRSYSYLLRVALLDRSHPCIHAPQSGLIVRSSIMASSFLPRVHRSSNFI
jgi:hypothetical protein